MVTEVIIVTLQSFLSKNSTSLANQSQIQTLINCMGRQLRILIAQILPNDTVHLIHPSHLRIKKTLLIISIRELGSRQM